jgi:hypothetical protein
MGRLFSILGIWVSRLFIILVFGWVAKTQKLYLGGSQVSQFGRNCSQTGVDWSPALSPLALPSAHSVSPVLAVGYNNSFENVISVDIKFSKLLLYQTARTGLLIQYATEFCEAKCGCRPEAVDRQPV